MTRDAKQQLFKIDPIALEKIRNAPTLEEAGVHWSDAAAETICNALENETFRGAGIEGIKKLIPGTMFDGFADNIYDFAAKGIVEGLDAIDGEDDVSYDPR